MDQHHCIIGELVRRADFALHNLQNSSLCSMHITFKKHCVCTVSYRPWSQLKAFSVIISSDASNDEVCEWHWEMFLYIIWELLLTTQKVNLKIAIIGKVITLKHVKISQGALATQWDIGRVRSGPSPPGLFALVGNNTVPAVLCNPCCPPASGQPVPWGWTGPQFWTCLNDSGWDGSYSKGPIIKSSLWCYPWISQVSSVPGGAFLLSWSGF